MKDSLIDKRLVFTAGKIDVNKVEPRSHRGKMYVCLYVATLETRSFTVNIRLRDYELNLIKTVPVHPIP